MAIKCGAEKGRKGQAPSKLVAARAEAEKDRHLPDHKIDPGVVTARQMVTAEKDRHLPG